MLQEEWHETVPFNIFVNTIKSESYRILNAFGLYGYRCSWSNCGFPLAEFLNITNRRVPKWNEESYCTNILEELKYLNENINKLDIVEVTKMDECTIYYEAWQLQCCGEPFSVGDNVEWTCIMPKEYKNAHGVIIDFEEEHHGFATHRIIGTITKIIAERSEFPKGERIVWYHRAPVIREELKYADGWESNRKSDETTEITFWGYIVEMKDVTIGPLNKEEVQ